MAEAFWAAGIVFVVMMLLQAFGPRVGTYLIDKMLARAERDPYFNREYARPKCEVVFSCEGQVHAPCECVAVEGTRRCNLHQRAPPIIYISTLDDDEAR